MSKDTVSKAKTEISNAASDATRTLARAADDAKSGIATAADNAVKLIASALAQATKVADKKTSDENNAGAFMGFIYKQGTLIVAIVGVCFGVYFTFANPSQDNDKALALQQQRVDAQAGTIVDLTKTQQNDTQEVKKAIENTNTQLQLQALEIRQLTTIIDERIPKK